ncbi:hypothetical protein [Streptomyces sp. NPDC046805]
MNAHLSSDRPSPLHVSRDDAVATIEIDNPPANTPAEQAAR